MRLSKNHTPSRTAVAGCALCLWLAASASAAPVPVSASTPAPPVLPTTAQDVLVDVATLDRRLLFDIKYATADNFTQRPLYSAARCLLRPAVAAQLCVAQDNLERQHGGLRLILKDCYRPVSIQRRLYDVVRDTPQAGYVANPDGPTGSVHTYGAAVDLSLADATGKEIDMGTPYDYLGRLAQPRYEAEYLEAHQLTPAQVRMRRLLRAAMVAAGFHPIPNEWWHFDALQGEALRARYDRLDVPF